VLVDNYREIERLMRRLVFWLFFLFGYAPSRARCFCAGGGGGSASEEVETPEGGEAEIEAKGPPEVVKPAVNKSRKKLRPSPVLKEQP
jgi:hypothetical protein